MSMKLSLGAVGSLVLALVAGCSGSDPAANDDVAGAEAQAVSTPEKLDLALTIAESKELFDSHMLSFAVKGEGIDLPCRDRSFFLTSKPSLFSGWSPDKAASFSEDVEGSKFNDYTFASCRDASTQALAWFGKSREFELTVTEQLLDKDYKPTKMPVLLKLEKLGASGAPGYYSCSSEFQKKLVGESEHAKKYEISLSCKKTDAPAKGVLGPIDFVEAPGPYGAVASYREWMLPGVASTKENLERVRAALLAQVGEGSYDGAMSTLGKTCGLKIEKTADGLVIDHTIKSSDRTRHLDLKTADLLGFTEGDLFEDPNRVSGAPIGKFAAAEFRDAKGESLVVRFEKNDNLDAQIVRINGSEAYCRRLVKK